MGTKETKASQSIEVPAIFRMYSCGVKTNRDSYVHSFNTAELVERVKTFIEIYNGTVDKLKRLGSGIEPESLIDTTDQRIKWTRQVKASLLKLQNSQYNEIYIRNCLFRPFTRKLIYFDDFWNEDRYQQHHIFPTIASEAENVAICVAGIGDRKGFGCLATNAIPKQDLAFETAQCFPYYTYAEDGSNRHDNITDWVLTQFQIRYNFELNKRDIFHYVYAMLHHPQYREQYAENLKRDLPRIPLLRERRDFEVCVHIGKQLIELHLNYEQAGEYPLKWVENNNVPINWHIEKMRLTLNKDAIMVNDWLTLTGIPEQCFQFKLGNRSALEWVIDQYQIGTDARSGISSNPNSEDEPKYIVRLVGCVVTVSIETVRLVAELERLVKLEEEIIQSSV